MNNTRILTLTAILVPIFGGTAQTEAPAGAAYISTESRTDYLTHMKQRIGINNRERDPFGLLQVIPNASEDPGPWVPRPPQTSFAELIGEIKIVAINAGDHSFLVPGRLLREGAIFPLVIGNRKLTVEVETVSPSAVTFKNLKSEETATISLAIDPRHLPNPDSHSLPEGVMRPSQDGESPLVLPNPLKP